MSTKQKQKPVATVGEALRGTFEDLQQLFNSYTHRVVCKCEAMTPIVGGVSATESGIRNFIKHQLGLEDPDEIDKAYQRICKEELGQRDLDTPGGELKEQLTYGINVIRRTSVGPWLGNWMIHANIKLAMSQLGVFQIKRGSKGNVAEGGVVRPHGISKLDNRPECVYLIGPDDKPAETYFDEFKGRVANAQGSKSIVHHSECAPPGTRFEYEFRFLGTKLSTDDVIQALSLAMNVGLGSTKALGSGKFRILDYELHLPERDVFKERRSSAKAR